MKEDRSEPAHRLLLFERDGLTADRLRQMARAEGFETCTVDSLELFEALRAALHFDLFVVGVCSSAELEQLRIPAKLSPLVLLAPLHGRGGVTHYRVAFPEADILGRDLADPNSLRRVVSTQGADDAASVTPDTVRTAFEHFGLSERQLDVLSRALLGESGLEIARRLFISELTVRNHLHSIYERVGVSGRRELLGRFVRGLIEGNA